MNFCACGGLLDRGVCEVCGHDDWEEKEEKQRKKIHSIERFVWAEMWRGMEPADPFGFNYPVTRGQQRQRNLKETDDGRRSCHWRRPGL
jgi:hypothetical protein